AALAQEPCAARRLLDRRDAQSVLERPEGRRDGALEPGRNVERLADDAARLESAAAAQEVHDPLRHSGVAPLEIGERLEPLREGGVAAAPLLEAQLRLGQPLLGLLQPPRLLVVRAGALLDAGLPAGVLVADGGDRLLEILAGFL